MATKVQYPKFTSPKGVFRFPKLNEPDTKFSDDGEFSVKLLLTDEQYAQFLDAPSLNEVSLAGGSGKITLRQLLETAHKEGEAAFAALPLSQRSRQGFQLIKNEPGNLDYDKDKQTKVETATGFVAVNFKAKARGISKATGKAWTRTIPIFDAKGTEPLKNPPKIWGGSEGRIGFEAAPYWVPATGACGLKFYLQAVRLTKLVEGGNRNASSYGFDGDDEGYTAADDYDQDAAASVAAPASSNSPIPF